MKPLLSIAVLCLNEAKNIAQTLTSLRKAQADAGLSELDIIIIDDGSSDNSREVFSCLAKQHSDIRVVHHEKNLGIL